MSDASVNNKRIAKNTLLLYFRMIIMMTVSLFTSRVVLDVLGIEDYGIYNVVGGVVAMFGFLNGSMAASTQRYLTFELGRHDYVQLTKVFSTSLFIHGLVALFVVLLAETVGLWFFYEKMTIPIERMGAALWVYQASVLSAAVMFLSVPYNACIIAHEKMSTFAYISILEVVLKLVIVYLLAICNLDKLKLYAVLMLAVQVSVRIVYGIYCKRHFGETHYKKVQDSRLLREMLSFAGWNLWGSFAGLLFSHGLNILLNMFFTPVVNAARGVAVQVQGALMQFTHNFQTAMNPQITKSYATGDMAYMHSLIFRNSKFTFFLTFALSLPVFMEAETILGLWLVKVPDYTPVFIRLMLCVSIIDSMASPFMVSAQATGRVKLYQSVVGGVLLLIVPISYIVLRLGGNPASVFVVHLCVCVIAFIVRLIIIRPMISLPLCSYTKEVIFPCILVACLASIIPLLLKNILYFSVGMSIANCVCSLFSVVLFSYILGLTRHERDVVKEKIAAIIQKIGR